MIGAIRHNAKTARGVLRGLQRTARNLESDLDENEAWGDGLHKGDLRAIINRLDCALADLDAVIEGDR